MVQTLKILTDAYISRVIRGQSTLKHVIERYFWNGLGPVFLVYNVMLSIYK